MPTGLGLGLKLQYAGQVWTPAALGASLLGWWDAERSDLITQSGGSVSSWKDKVAGYDAAQSTGSAKPTYSATSFNSRPGVTFDGIDDTLSLESVPFPSGSTACEFWLLADRTALGADTAIRVGFSYGGNSPINNRRAYSQGVSGTSRSVISAGDGAASVSATNNAVDAFGRHVRRHVVTSSSIAASVDGTALASQPVTPATGTTRTRIGSNTSDTPAQFDQVILNTVIVTLPLAADQADRLAAYLKARGGIA